MEQVLSGWPLPSSEEVSHGHDFIALLSNLLPLSPRPCSLSGLWLLWTESYWETHARNSNWATDSLVHGCVTHLVDHTLLVESIVWPVAQPVVQWTAHERSYSPIRPLFQGLVWKRGWLACPYRVPHLFRSSSVTFNREHNRSSLNSVMNSRSKTVSLSRHFAGSNFT